MYKESKQILEEIKKANRILLHCHPMPDPDSVCSALAMKFALESLGKQVTVIKGDSDIPEAFMHFPGAHDIVKKNFHEINQDDFDSFIVLDSASTVMISMKNTPVFPLSIKTISIDHHPTHTRFADINLVDDSSPATAFILFNLLNNSSFLRPVRTSIKIIASLLEIIIIWPGIVRRPYRGLNEYNNI